MESKKINQLATNVAPQTSDLTIIGDPTTGVSKKITLLQIANLFATTGTVSSVAVTESGDALTITGSPITSAGTINIGFAGAATQYVRGDGALADFPTSTGGGSSVSYYLNSSVSQGTIGGNAYRQLSKTPVIGAGTDITISANGYVANYITDANDPALLEVPGGNFNCEFYFSVNSNNHNPFVYAELYKYDGTTFTLLGSNQAIPDYLSNGTTLSAYYFAIPVATAALTITDRLAIRIFVNVDGKVVTLHTENGHLCQVVTSFSKGLTSLNNLTRQVQFLATGTSGTDFNISSSTATHTFNLPVASATNTGKLSSTDWSTFNAKQPAGNYVTLDTTQTITAAKTFSGAVSFNSSLQSSPIVNFGLALVKGNTPSATSGIWSQLYSASGSNNLIIADDVNISKLQFQAASSYSYTFPAANGTIALTSNLSSYVPYTGATTSVDLGTNTLSAGNTKINDTLYLKLATTYTHISGYYGISVGTNIFVINNSASTQAVFSLASLTTSRTFTLPDANGTIALTSDLSGYVTLSTTQTITGVKTFTQNLSLDGNGSNAGTLLLKSNTALPTAIGYTSLNTTSNTIYLTTYVSNPKSAAFDLSGITDNTIRIFTLPNTNGTLALTSNLSAYLPLSGGTLTGALSGTSATFSGSVTTNSNLVVNKLSDSDYLALKIENRPITNSNTSSGYIGFYSNPGNGSNNTLSTGRIYGKFDANSYAAARLTFSTVTGDDVYQDVMTLKGTNVGIGTSSPQGALEVVGLSYFTRSSQSTLFNPNYGGANTHAQLQVIGNMALAFATNGDNERMRITSGGNVLIGKNNETFSNTGVELRANGNIRAIIDGATAVQLNRLTSNGDIIEFWRETALVGSISVTTTGTSYNIISDYRLKEDLKEINGLEKLSQIKVYDFKWKIDGSRMDGVIAHELAEVIPYAVLGKKDAKEMQQVDYSKLVPILVKAVQELEARIKQLENK